MLALRLIGLVAFLTAITSNALIIPPTIPDSTPFHPIRATSHASFQTQAEAIRPTPDIQHTFHWHFPVRNSNWLIRQHASVSDPNHSQYQQFLTKDVIDAMLEPDYDTSVKPVFDWLTANGVDTKHIHYSDFALTVTSNVTTIESLFNIRFHYYSHEDNDQRRLIRSSDHITIPDHLRLTLDLIRHVNDLPPKLIRAGSPVTHSDGLRRFHTMSTDGALLCPFTSDWAVTTTPYYIANQYYWPVNPADQEAVWNGVNLAVVGGIRLNDGPSGQSVGEFYNPTDFSKFVHDLNYRTQTPMFVNASWSTANDAQVSHSPNYGVPGGEASLDIDAAFAFCPQCRVGLFAMGLDDTGFLNVFTNIYNLNASDRPHIVSLSYYWGTDLNAPQRDATDRVFAQLALLGVTILVCSGDDGAVGPYNRACSNYGYQHSSASDVAGPMVSMWPASSPFVTSIGATDFLGGINETNWLSGGYFNSSDGSNSRQCGQCPSPASDSAAYFCQISAANAEQSVSVSSSVTNAWPTGFSSGGGFSMYANRPTWQSTAVDAYLNTQCSNNTRCSLPAADYYHSTGRGYPDVSFYGGWFSIGFAGQQVTWMGTSLSTPGFAGIVAQLTNLSISLTNKSLGFINPLLYQMFNLSLSLPSSQRAFNDIVIGDNVCPRPLSPVTASNCHSQCAGYYATSGWDPVTGVGTPRLANILAILPRLLNNRTTSFQSSSSSGVSSSTSGSHSTISSTMSSSSAVSSSTSGSGRLSSTMSSSSAVTASSSTATSLGKSSSASGPTNDVLVSSSASTASTSSSTISSSSAATASSTATPLDQTSSGDNLVSVSSAFTTSQSSPSAVFLLIFLSASFLLYV